LKLTNLALAALDRVLAVLDNPKTLPRIKTVALGLLVCGLLADVISPEEFHTLRDAVLSMAF
jgi:energy-converting hydrogenase Eha subunit F